MKGDHGRIPARTGRLTGRETGDLAGYGRPTIMTAEGGRHACYGAARGDARGWRHRLYATGIPSWERFQEYLPGIRKDACARDDTIDVMEGEALRGGAGFPGTTKDPGRA